MKRTCRTTAVLMAALIIVGCTAAQQQAARHQAVTVDTALYKATEGFRLMAGDLRKAGAITDAQFRDVNRKLVPVYDAGLTFTQALRAWHPGDPVPVDFLALAQAITSLRQFLTDLSVAAPVRQGLLDALAKVDTATIGLVGGGA